LYHTALKKRKPFRQKCVLHEVGAFHDQRAKKLRHKSAGKTACTRGTGLRSLGASARRKIPAMHVTEIIAAARAGSVAVTPFAFSAG